MLSQPPNPKIKKQNWSQIIKNKGYDEIRNIFMYWVGVHVSEDGEVYPFPSDGLSVMWIQQPPRQSVYEPFEEQVPIIKKMGILKFIHIEITRDLKEDFKGDLNLLLFETAKRYAEKEFKKDNKQ